MDSIIFDVDGTLWNSTEIVAKAWSEVVRLEPDIHVEITASSLTPLFGKILPEIAQALFPKESKERQLNLINKCYPKMQKVRYLKNPDPYRGWRCRNC